MFNEFSLGQAQEKTDTSRCRPPLEDKIVGFGEPTNLLTSTHAQLPKYTKLNMICIQYTYTHTCMHACMHTCIHAYMRSCIHAYMHTYMHTYTHKSMHPCIHACAHTCMHTCIHASMHPCIQSMHPCIHTCMHAYMHTCIHASPSVNLIYLIQFVPKCLYPAPLCRTTAPSALYRYTPCTVPLYPCTVPVYPLHSTSVPPALYPVYTRTPPTVPNIWL